MTFLVIYAIIGLVVALFAAAGQFLVFRWSMFKDWQWYIGFFLCIVVWPWAVAMIVQSVRGK